MILYENIIYIYIMPSSHFYYTNEKISFRRLKMFDFENNNPYAHPQSSGQIAYEEGINEQSLQYLRSAGK